MASRCQLRNLKNKQKMGKHVSSCVTEKRKLFGKKSHVNDDSLNKI
jgi:hypothetical protein